MACILYNVNTTEIVPAKEKVTYSTAAAARGARTRMGLDNNVYTVAEEVYFYKNVQKKMTLRQFTAEINRLEHVKCAKLNAECGCMFFAEHYDYPESMMQIYYDAGYTPMKAIEFMDFSHEAEMYAEALAS